MFFDLQLGSMLKRISAWLLDIILLAVLATGFSTIVSGVIGYDAQYEKLRAGYEKYEKEYGISFDKTTEEIGAMTVEEQAVYQAAADAVSADAELNRQYALLVNMQLIIITIGILLAVAVLEFAVPLFLKNGQTIGKKIFALCLIQTDQTKVRNISVAIRTFLGKYTIETMVPVLIAYMIFNNSIGIMGIVILGLLLLLELVVMITTKTNSAIHDLLAGTVVVDAKSQMIFDNLEALEAYKKKIEQNTNEKGYV